jgi:hypothetical protein
MIIALRDFLLMSSSVRIKSFALWRINRICWDTRVAVRFLK